MRKYLPPLHKFRPKTLDSIDTVDFTHFRRTVNRYCVIRCAKNMYLVGLEVKSLVWAFINFYTLMQCSAKVVFLRHLTHNFSKYPTLFEFSGTLSHEICIYVLKFFHHLSLVLSALSHNILRKWDICALL